MASENRNPFISVQYLRANSIINDNVDANVLLPIIRMAESKYVQQVIGSNLYVKLVTDANANTITGNYQILLEDYIIPVLLQYSVYESVPFMAYKFRNKGIQKQSGDNSEPADLTELTYIRDNVLQTAQFYSERLSKYLINNATLFPEYQSSTTDLNPNSQSYFNGIHIPNRYGIRCIGDPGGEINL